MPWICRNTVSGGFSGTDDFSGDEEDFGPIELQSLLPLLALFHCQMLESSAGRVLITPVQGDTKYFEAELRKIGLKWVNDDVGSESAGPHWRSYAQLWQHIKSPLRPCSQDLNFIEKNLARITGKTANGILLGVTQEISRKTWHNFKITCVDNEMAMIKRVWGDESTPPAICADWFNLPFPENTFDIALGDGSLNVILYKDYLKISEQLNRVLTPEGLFSVRVYVQPKIPEDLDGVIKDLPRIPNFHAFKWRLAMAVQAGNTEKGVKLADIWKTYSQYFNDCKLALLTGWPIEEISTINAYRDNNTVYSFPRVNEVISVFSSNFNFVNSQTGTYELAERCPTLLFEKK